MDHRVRYYLVFDGRPQRLTLALGDLDLEMRAVALLQRHRRKKRLPLRLLADVMWSGSDEPIADQISAELVPKSKVDVVVRHLEDFTTAYSSWLRGEIAPPDFLEAQHSLITNLALDLVPGVTADMSYPGLVTAARLPTRLENQCKQLGRDRNRVKHRGYRHEAARYVEEHEETLRSAVRIMTGYTPNPRPPVMVRWEANPKSAFRQAPAYTRFGEARRFTRY